MNHVLGRVKPWPIATDGSELDVSQAHAKLITEFMFIAQAHTLCRRLLQHRLFPHSPAHFPPFYHAPSLVTPCPEAAACVLLLVRRVELVHLAERLATASAGDRAIARWRQRLAKAIVERVLGGQCRRVKVQSR
jgi:hypothetical protein